MPYGKVKRKQFRYHIQPSEYLALKDMYWTTYSDGFYWDKKEKEWVHETEFKKRYKLPVSLHANSGTSSDSTKQWLAS